MLRCDCAVLSRRQLRGSSVPVLRTGNSSGAIPRARSMDRTTSARAALSARLDISLPVASVWPTIITRTEKPSRSPPDQFAQLAGKSIEFGFLTRRGPGRIRVEFDDVRLDGIAQANECWILDVGERGEIDRRRARRLRCDQRPRPFRPSAAERCRSARMTSPSSENDTPRGGSRVAVKRLRTMAGFNA